MSLKLFSQIQKLTIVKNAATIGLKAAAEIAGVDYTTLKPVVRQARNETGQAEAFSDNRFGGGGMPGNPETTDGSIDTHRQRC